MKFIVSSNFSISKEFYIVKIDIQSNWNMINGQLHLIFVKNVVSYILILYKFDTIYEKILRFSSKKQQILSFHAFLEK